MKRDDLIKRIAQAIVQTQKNSPTLVGIDGVDGSGKTTFAKELVEELQKSGRQIIFVSIDHFHNPENVRYARGRDSAEGYYRDSFNNDAIKAVLLDPLKSGDRHYKTGVFDYATDTELDLPEQVADEDAIVIMEGIFLLRPELVEYWDLKVLLDVDFETTLERVQARKKDQEHLGDAAAIVQKYKDRYIPGQQLYFEEAQPRQQADFVIDNRDFENPEISKGVQLREGERRQLPTTARRRAR